MLTRWIADCLSPPRCSACDAPVATSRVAFCVACAGSIDRNDAAEGDGFWPRVVTVGAFGGALAVAIRRLKYGGRTDLARPLGELLAQACARARIRGDIVVPVPLHPIRLVARGYNQASLLGAYVARTMEARLCARALARVVDTAPQAELPRAERLENVADAFRVLMPGTVARRRVVLVDDVATTGATVRACARALREAGARGVNVAVVARTPGGDEVVGWRGPFEDPGRDANPCRRKPDALFAPDE